MTISIVFVLFLKFKLTKCSPQEKRENNPLPSFTRKTFAYDEGKIFHLDSIDLKAKTGIDCFPMLMLRISEFHCSSCIQFELDNLKELPEEIRKQTFILTTFENSRTWNSLAKGLGLGLPVINTTMAESQIHFEKYNSPYYLVINKYNCLSNFHTSNKEEIKSSIDYYNSIRNQFRNFRLRKENNTPVKINKSSHDFGNIEKGTEYVTYFTIENCSNTPVEIEDVLASCGCTKVEWERKPIKPQKKLRIKVKYHANDTGDFFQKITLAFKNGSGIRIISIKGKVL